MTSGAASLVLLNLAQVAPAIEADSDSPKIKQYQDYLAGKYELSRDERDQIGFRLGKELNLPKIYGVDADGDFPFLAVQDYAKAHGREKELESLMAQAGKAVQDENEFLKSHSVLQMLLRMNSSEAVRQGLAGYALFAHFGEEYNYPGARLLTEWYRRNMRIHTHLLNILEPGDRVLVVFGAESLCPARSKSLLVILTYIFCRLAFGYFPKIKSFNSQ